VAVDLPFGLERSRNIEAEGLGPWVRRVALAVLGAVCLLALLDVFGQRSAMASADSPAALLAVDSPERLRGGLIFTSEFVVTPHRQLQDARIVLSEGWVSGMTLNGIAPQPQADTSTADELVLDLGQMDAGAAQAIWISWQTNPTTVGSRNADIQLDDGTTPLVRIDRTVVVFP
jgi:hypothetical protein